MRPYSLTAALILLFTSSHLQAQVTEPAGETAPAAVDATTTAQPAATEDATKSDEVQAADDKKWKFYTIGYVWLATAKGATDVIGPVEPVDLDLSLGDVIDGFKFIFMGAAEARKDRFVLIGDVSFVHLEAKDGIGIRDPNFLEAELDSRTAEITLIGGYRAVSEGALTVDLLAGGRMNFFKTTLQLEGPSQSADGSVSQKWFDPLIAARGKIPLGGKWDMSLYGDLGGIMFGSDVTWQGIATVDYQITRKMNVGVGWRHWKVNYDDGDFLYNVRQTGPLIALRSQL